MRQSDCSHRLHTIRRLLKVLLRVLAARDGEALAQAIHNGTTTLFVTSRIAHSRKVSCNSPIGNDERSFDYTFDPYRDWHRDGNRRTTQVPVLRATVLLAIEVQSTLVRFIKTSAIPCLSRGAVSCLDCCLELVSTVYVT